jgi:hypothetical protein
MLGVLYATLFSVLGKGENLALWAIARFCSSVSLREIRINMSLVTIQGMLEDALFK